MAEALSTTAALGSSPWVELGMANATASATEGWARRVSSISRGEIFSPDRMPDQFQIPFRIQHAFVAGPEPAVSHALAIGFGIVFVALSDVRAFDDHFPGHPVGLDFSTLVHDRYFHPGATPHRARHALAIKQRIRGYLMGCFSHAIGFQYRDPERFLHLNQYFRRERCTARTDEAQSSAGHLSRFTATLALGTVQQGLMDRGHCRIPGNQVGVYRRPKVHRVESGGHHDGPS